MTANAFVMVVTPLKPPCMVSLANIMIMRLLLVVRVQSMARAPMILPVHMNKARVGQSEERPLSIKVAYVHVHHKLRETSKPSKLIQLRSTTAQRQAGEAPFEEPVQGPQILDPYEWLQDESW